MSDIPLFNLGLLQQEFLMYNRIYINKGFNTRITLDWWNNHIGQCSDSSRQINNMCVPHTLNDIYRRLVEGKYGF